MLRVFVTLLASLILVGGVHLFGAKIINGFQVDIADNPWQVAILKHSQFSCGGSIISPMHILTAAHCFKNVSVKDVLIRSGSVYHDEGGKISKIQLIECHPKFNLEIKTNYDVCVLTLKELLNFNKVTRAIALGKDEPQPGSQGLVTGWGSFSAGGLYPDALQGVILEVIDRKTCRDRFRAIESKRTISSHMICTHTGRKDTCRGDSGGGLIVNQVQVGIVSFGIGCAYSPGVYANVPALRNFIDRATCNFATWI